MLTSLLPTFNLKNKRVLLRADLNVPLRNGVMVNDYRLQALLPTIKYIHQAGAKIILATHIGRPLKNDPALSTRLLMPWFEQQGYTIHFQPDLTSAHAESLKNLSTILLLENMRFFPGEKNGDPIFAHQLASLADYYVNDAFGTLHRTDTSVTLTPSLFDPDKRTIGFLVAHEMTMLDHLRTNTQQPFTLVLGGGKVADKIPLIKAVLPRLHALLLCPAISNTFVKAMGKPMGKSLIDEKAIPECTNILKEAADLGVMVQVPIDYYITRNTFNGSVVTDPVTADAFPDYGVALSIGPETVVLYAQEFMKDQTIFMNGLMGDLARPETLHGTKALFDALGQSPAKRYIGGGDSVAAAYQLNSASSFDYISTGGGATLAYISGEILPGLAALTNRTKT